MNSLQVAANVILPMAMMMGVGVVMRLTGVTDRPTMKKVDTIIFRVLMSVLMFYNIYNADLSQLANAGYIVYGIGGLFVLFLIAVLVVPRFVRPAPTAAAFGQAVMRPNYVLFGVAVAQNLYGEGNVGILMLMGAVCVPVFNVMSTVILEVGRSAKISFGGMILSVLKNPMIVAAIIGLAVKLVDLRLPAMVVDVISDLSGMASPLSFLSLGVSLNLAVIGKKARLLTAGCLCRLVLIPAVMLTIAYVLGFRGQQMCALMVLFAAPTAVASYPMAVAMDADGELAGQMVAFSTLFALPTIFAWTAILSALGAL